MLACVICSGSGEVNEKIVNFGPCTSCRNCSATETESCAGTWGPVSQEPHSLRRNSLRLSSLRRSCLRLSSLSLPLWPESTNCCLCGLWRCAHSPDFVPMLARVSKLLPLRQVEMRTFSIFPATVSQSQQIVASAARARDLEVS